MRQRNIQNGIPTNDDSTKIFGSKIYLFRIYVYVCGLKTKSNSNMTLQQMEYIVAVYRLRHFAKAAEYCGTDFCGLYNRYPVSVGDIDVPDDAVTKLLGYKAKIRRMQKKAQKAAEEAAKSN